MKIAKLIAEIGCNHKGDINIAKDMIKTASIFCKVDGVKFQKRNNKELLTLEKYNAPHPNKSNSYGNTYGEHREKLEFNLETHKELKSYCEDFGLEYSCSVWDLTSAKEISSLNPKMIKVPSACNTNKNLIKWLCNNYFGKIHISLGMTTQKEEEWIIAFFQENERIGDLVLYGCTSGYPVPDEDVCLLEVKRLHDTYGDIINDIGFSGHHKGICLDTVAFSLGANYIERHFTLDRTWKGTDHAASLEPDGLRRLKRDLISTQKALTYKSSEILAIEKPQRDKLKIFAEEVNN